MRRLTGVLLVATALALYLGCDSKSPKARARRLVSTVEKAREAVFSEMEAAALPRPPRSVDLLTGGDFGAAMDLKQAVESGFPPSCEIIYKNSLGSLKGMIGHYSKCLGVPLPAEVRGRVEALLPPGLEAEASLVHENLTEPQKRALQSCSDIFLKAFQQVSVLGPFEGTSVVFPGDSRAGDPRSGEPRREALATRFIPKSTSVEGLGTVWNYSLELPPSGKLFAGVKDSSIWFASSSGASLKVFHIKGAELLSHFELQNEGGVIDMKANSKGIVLFGSRVDPTTHAAAGTFLTQYDLNGKSLWTAEFKWTHESLGGHLMAMDRGDVYLYSPGMLRGERIPSAVWVNPEGVVGKLRWPDGLIPEGPDPIGGFYEAGDACYAVLHGASGYGLYRIVDGGFQFQLKAGYTRSDGNLLQVGDDGHFYLFEYGRPSGITRLDGPQRGSGWKLPMPNDTYGQVDGDFHMGNQGEAYVLFSGGIAIWRPKSSPADRPDLVVPFSEGLPRTSKMVAIGHGRFLAYWYNSDFSNAFTVVELASQQPQR